MDFRKFADCEHCEKESCKNCIIDLIGVIGDAVNDCIILHDYEKIVYANESVCKTLSLVQDDAIGNNFFGFIPGEKSHLFENKIVKFREEGYIEPFIYSYNIGEETQWLEITARKIMQYMLVITKNITAQKLAEELLDEKELEIIKLKLKTLTKTEKKIFHAIRQMKNSREIARNFDVTISTIDNHVYNINKKLGFKSRIDLCVFAHKFSVYLMA
jgi:PAS domain S-box-containing protein